MGSDAIQMYWWEGYYGIPYVIRRMSSLNRPFVKNFGDQISPFIVSSLSGRPVAYRTGAKKLLALGSIFFSLSDGDLVWGSGLLRPEHLVFARKAKNVQYLAVRGPRTYETLKSVGIDCPQVFGDPAQLLPNILEDDIVKEHDVGIVPHFSHLRDLKSEFENSQIKVIDVEQPFAMVLKDILSCKSILSTSLHGVIVAEAYGLPALLLVNRNPLHGSLFKFEDYFHATGRDLIFGKVTELHKLDALVERAYQVPKPTFEPLKLLQAFPCLSGDSSKMPLSKFAGASIQKLNLVQLSKHILANPYVKHG